MATLEPNAISSVPPGEIAAARVAGPKGWKRRLEDPFNTYYRYPLALAMTRWLVHTPVTPNQVSLVQPVFAAASGYLLTFEDVRAHIAAVVLFELRSILDCVDGSLARAKRMSSPNGHAIDAMADWLGVVFLYCGIFHYVYNHVPAGYTTTTAMAVVTMALAQGAIRSFASDYFKSKYMGIYERATDDVPQLLRDKVLGLSKSSSLFAHIDVFIMRTGHFFFEFERFCPARSKALSSQAIEHMVREQSTTRARINGFLWSISSGDAFLSFVILSILVGKLWAGQLFFATVGVVWIAAVVLYNVAFLRGYRCRD
ncbi:MAG: CDP-alcohol phosphatidyltransferase family protein [Polyangiaceae bacterium]|nr:CDP-alcohol phosphatidyltransferase family protein [Polyangiaceae bacterium]